MILHWLGLDHIGHSIGARNRFVQSKLDQYDRILDEIVSKLEWNDVLVLTSDHGMIDRGGHGGNSDEETILPVSIISKQLKDRRLDRDNLSGERKIARTNVVQSSIFSLSRKVYLQPDRLERHIG